MLCCFPAPDKLKDPILKHRFTKDALHMDAHYHHLSWVKESMPGLPEAPCAMKTPQEDVNTNQNYNSCLLGREILSLEDALASLEAGLLPQPSVDDFACILHRCRKDRNPAHVLRLHAHIRKNGLEAHTSLGNHLVSMLAKAGCVHNAQQVFDKLIYWNQSSWNSLIIGYVKCGEPQHALILYQNMQHSVHPSPYAFVALLQACAKLKDMERGCQIHAKIARTGLLERDLFVGSTLVDMYAKCGLVAKAQEVFDKLPFQNVVMWNALIMGYAKNGHGAEALNCFNQMQHEGISPNAVTFICSLKACSSIGATDIGQKIHAEIARKGLERDLLVGSTLVDMYAKLGLLAKAQESFDKLPVRDVVSWTALIAGYAEHDNGEEALNCLDQMQQEGVYPNAVTFACSLKACGSLQATDKGRRIHAEIARKGLVGKDLVLGNALVDMYAKCSLLVEAQDVFHKLPIRDVVSWNTLITGYVERGFGEEALKCFDQMQQDGVSRDAVTFVCGLKACGSIGATDKGCEIHAEIARKNLLESDLVVGNALVDMYAKCGLPAKAQEVFNKLPVRDIISWTALISGYAEHEYGEEALNYFEEMQHDGFIPDAVTFACSLKACGSLGAIEKGREIYAEIASKGLEKDHLVGNALFDIYAKCGLLVEAREVFDKLPIQDVVSWTALITGYMEHGHCEEALNCLEHMQLEGISPNAVSLICSLKACGSIGATNKGREIHADITGNGLLERDLAVGNALVDMYAKCGLLAKAQEIFDKLPVQDVVSWNTLITGYAQLGESETVFHIFNRMLVVGEMPNPVTFISVLNACSHAGLVDKGQMYFEAMSKYYGIIPTLEHFTCMVDLLGRTGQLDKAVAIVMEMPFQPDLVLWHTVLGACQKWGNLEFGRRAFEHAVQLDEKNAVAYICMSNIYADADMQKESNNVEALRVKNKSFKQPGHGLWIDTG